MATNISPVVWQGSEVSEAALHNLTYYCPHNSTDEVVTHIVSPSTFFIQLVRLSLSFVVVTTLLLLYNSIRVLERTILSTSTCSLYWVIMSLLVAVKSALLMVFIPLAATSEQRHSTTYNQVGFIVTMVIQMAVVYTLYLAIEHEIRFRSPDFATVNSPFRRHCIALNWRKILCSWQRVVVMAISLLPLILLIVIEVLFEKHESSTAHSALVWVFVASLPLPRFCVLMAAGYIIFKSTGHFQPSLNAKIFLSVGLLLSILEDIPSSVFTIAPNLSPKRRCLLDVMTLYDLFQLVGIFSLIPLALFVRSQYLRVEQECKLNLVWDIQRLLQVNGRKDIVKRYT